MRLALLLLSMACTLCVQAQDESKRLHPLDWLDQPMVKDVFSRSRQKGPGFVSKINMGQENAVLIGPSGQSSWWNRDGDFRLVTDSLGQNLSLSHNLGFNHGSFLFSHRGRRYSVGGRGYWRCHAELIEFVEKTGQWELIKTNVGPGHVRQIGSWLDQANGSLVSAEIYDIANAEDDVTLWSLDIGAMEWSKLGKVNPKFSLYLNATDSWLELEDYVVLVGQQQGLIVRKSDMNTVVTGEWNTLEYKAAMAREGDCIGVYRMAQDNVLRVWQYFPEGQERAVLKWNVDSLYSALALDAALVSFVQPIEAPLSTAGAVVLNETVDSPVSRSQMAWLILGALVIGIFFSRWAWPNGQGKVKVMREQKGLQGRTQQDGALDGGLREERNAELNGALSPLIVQLEQLDKRVLGTDEINLLFGLTADVSAESKRAKRAQYIREVNREYRVLHKEDLIRREKDSKDRRRTIYIIHPRSKSA